jgi:hypothetical protein
LALLLSGCGARLGGGALAARAPDAPLVIDLPALTVDYHTDGTAYLGSVPAIAVGTALGVDLAPLNLTPAQVALLIDADIAAVQITNTPDALLILVNGRPLPPLRWTAESLTTTAETLQALAPPLQPLTALLPTLATLGGGVILRFPTPGAAPVDPLAMTTVPTSTLAADQAAYLAAIGAPPALAIEVFYAPDGRWTVDGLDATAWSALLPLPWARLNLDANTIQTLRSAGITTLTLRSDRNGLFVTVNERPLPYLSWANGELNNVIILAEEGGIFRQLLDDTPTAYSLAVTLERLLPLVQMTAVTLQVHFVPD